MENRNRRKMLASISTGMSLYFAGCIEGQAENRDRENNSTDSSSDSEDNGSCDQIDDIGMTDNGPTEGYPEVDIEIDDTEMNSIQISAAVIQQFSDREPARVQITFMNDSNDQREFGFGTVQPFDGLEGRHVEEDEWLYLNPDEGYSLPAPDEPIDGCWKLEDDDFGFTDDDSVAELGPCESLSNKYSIYSDTAGSCLREGEYRFEDDYVGESGHVWGISVILGVQD